MTTHSFEVTLNEDGNRLDKTLARRLDIALEGGFSRNKTKKLLDAGKVRRNGEVERYGSTRLDYDDILEVEIDPEVVGSPKLHQNVELGGDRVLWEDEFVMVVDKPSGLVTQATRDPDRDHLVAAVRRLLRSRGEDNPYVAVHHRLDVGTSGVVALAVDRAANKGLSEAFQNRRADKTYRAVVRAEDQGDGRQTGEVWTVENHLAEKRVDGTTRQVPVDSGGDWARTHFEVVDTGGQLLDVEARPETGRRHQIRAHLAGEGLPIVGDDRYGGPDRVGGREVERLMLHARRLRLPHPVEEGETIVVESPLPGTFRGLLSGEVGS